MSSGDEEGTGGALTMDAWTLVNVWHDQVEAEIQAGMDRLTATRTLPVLG